MTLALATACARLATGADCWAGTGLAGANIKSTIIAEAWIRMV
jgi:hypothetical protein